MVALSVGSGRDGNPHSAAGGGAWLWRPHSGDVSTLVITKGLHRPGGGAHHGDHDQRHDPRTDLFWATAGRRNENRTAMVGHIGAHHDVAPLPDGPDVRPRISTPCAHTCSARSRAATPLQKNRGAREPRDGAVVL
ncbi:hypothetical protein CC_3553 [Caulobacter vibrioides CB15]|uniref:Uncharacterized protein n=1 Tax=Caulobacter vibrioides (strain ATCC 19089 / CIP 103742 / CB 15) TaxID=190650 RepID=Q9A2K8_CAUVC|nr:hypothetical protein CC_3553 [Caulobacter vibrioides CB15]